MGGLINSSTVKGDLWMVEAGGNMACYPLATTAEGPGPRVGHASLLVGNAFIVYGGDTKMEDSDVLDETLYLLNTCGLPPSLHRCKHTLLRFFVSDLSSSYSNPPMVEGCTWRAPPCWKIRPFFEHPWLKNIRIWRSSRRLFHE